MDAPHAEGKKKSSQPRQQQLKLAVTCARAMYICLDNIAKRGNQLSRAEVRSSQSSIVAVKVLDNGVRVNGLEKQDQTVGAVAVEIISVQFL